MLGWTKGFRASDSTRGIESDGRMGLVADGPGIEQELKNVQTKCLILT